MRLGGLEIEPIEENTLGRTDWGILKEKGKHPTKFLWVESYERDFRNGIFSRQCHLLECSSRGTITLDGARITEEDDLKVGSALFKMSVFS